MDVSEFLEMLDWNGVRVAFSHGRAPNASVLRTNEGRSRCEQFGISPFGRRNVFLSREI